MQFKTDELDQFSRRDNLRITGLPEAADEEEEGNLIQKVCNVAEQAGVPPSEHDISSCQRLGKSQRISCTKILVRFTARRKRDTLYKVPLQFEREGFVEGSLSKRGPDPPSRF